MWKKSKRIKSILLLIGIAIAQVNCFYVKQGLYVFHYSLSAEHNDRILEKQTTTERTKKFLMLVNEIRNYAFDSIGLKKNNNYTSMVNVDDNYLINVVSGCEKTAFNKYVWKYPIFGSAPYKGFFERDDAIREAKKLEKKGYDTYIGKSDAFSTLGILPDPLYSYMSDYSEYTLASMIIHEQTHATIFIKNQIQFNEQTATFVGDQGALNFIRMKYGENSAQYKEIFLLKDDYDTFINSIRGLHGTLDSMYKKATLTNEQKIACKDSIISKYKRDIMADYTKLFKTENYKAIEKVKINNAYITARMTYNQNLSHYDSLYKKNSFDLQKTVAYLITLKKKKVKDPEESLKVEAGR